MAIELDPRTVPCREHPDQPAGGFGRWKYGDAINGGKGYWWPWCEADIEHRRQAPDFEYFYLDSTRQRRPHPDPDCIYGAACPDHGDYPADDPGGAQ